MKKKHVKFKPLQELYRHGDTLFNSKAVGLSKIILEELTLQQEASYIPSTSCMSSYSEDFQSLDSLKAPLTMLQSATTFKTMVQHHDQDAFDCQGDDISCISKDDGAVMISSEQFGSADKNVTSSAASVSSSCPDILEKSLNGQSIRNGSPADQTDAEESDQNSIRLNAQDGLGHKISEIIHTSVKTETILSDENTCAMVLNSFGGNENLMSDLPNTSTQELHLQSHNMMHGDESDDLVDVRVCDICGDVGREALLALCSKCSDGAEHIYCMNPKMDKVPDGDWLCEECMLMQEPKRQRQDLVDRQDNASKPSSCLEELSQGSLTTNSAVQYAGKMKKNHSSKAFRSSDKRLDSLESTMALKLNAKKRIVQLLKISGPKAKAQLAQISSLKNMDVGKDAPRQVSSFVGHPAKKKMKQACSSGHRLPKTEQQFCGGRSVDSLISNLEAQRSREDKRKSSAKENAGCKLKKDHPERKEFKSLSFTGIGIFPPDASNAHPSVSTIKRVRSGSRMNSTEKCSKSGENKTNQVGVSFSGSSPMKVGSSRTKVVPKIVKPTHSSRKNVEDKRSIHVKGNTNVKMHGSLAHEGKSSLKTSVAGSVEDRKSPYLSSYVVNSPAKKVNAYPDQRASSPTQRAELHAIVTDENDHSVASCKILPNEFQPVKIASTLIAAEIDHMVPSAISAVPESRCIWKGTFKLEESGKLPTDCYGVQAHLSTRASTKVDELVLKFSPEILLNEVPRLHTWPIQFQKIHPTEQDIALYFFAQDLWSYERSYRILLEGMTNHDLALEANFDGFQLLIFPSSLLPVKSQCWNSLPYIWGIFRVKKVDDCSSYLPSLNVTRGLYSPATIGSESTIVSAPISRSAFASHTFHNSMQGPDSVDPVVLQSSALIKSGDQSDEHEVPLLELNTGTLKNFDVKADTIAFAHGWRKEDTGGGQDSDDLQKGKRSSNKDIKSISKTDKFQCAHSTREHTKSIGFYSNGSYKSPSSSQVCDSASEFCLEHNVTSGISFSLDLGPSGPFSGGGCATSADEAQEERSEYPMYNTLNLDLCLGNRPGSKEEVDLDLVLGVPSNSKYQPKASLKDGSNQDGNVSLALSLGMPCSSC